MIQARDEAWIRTAIKAAFSLLAEIDARREGASGVTRCFHEAIHDAVLESLATQIIWRMDVRLEQATRAAPASGPPTEGDTSG